MTRQSRYMWTNAFGNLNPPPPPVESINEPSYAALLFEPYCSVVVSRTFQTTIAAISADIRLLLLGLREASAQSELRHHETSLRHTFFRIVRQSYIIFHTPPSNIYSSYMKSRIASSALTRWGIWHNRSWSLLHHNMGMFHHTSRPHHRLTPIQGQERWWCLIFKASSTC